MTEIKVGSEWTPTTYETLVRVIVRGVFTDTKYRERVFVENVWEDGAVTFNSVARNAFLGEYRRVVPFFEKGKVYKLKESPTRLRYYVRGFEEFKGAKYAIAERTGHADRGDILVLLSQVSFEGFEVA